MAPPSGIVQIRGHTTVARHEAIPAANDALNDCGILLEDMHEYSNRVTTYRFEIAKDEVATLAQALVRAGFVLEDPDPATAVATVRADADDFVRATLQLTFPAEDGKRRNANPDLG